MLLGYDAIPETRSPIPFWLINKQGDKILDSVALLLFDQKTRHVDRKSQWTPGQYENG